MGEQSELFGDEEAPVQQVEWWCPACDEAHYVMVMGSKWQYNGNATFPTIHPNIRTITENRVCNCKIRNGQIEYLDDSTHNMAGLTVTLEGFREWRTSPNK